ARRFGASAFSGLGGSTVLGSVTQPVAAAAVSSSAIPIRFISPPPPARQAAGPRVLLPVRGAVVRPRPQRAGAGLVLAEQFLVEVAVGPGGVQAGGALHVHVPGALAELVGHLLQGVVAGLQGDLLELVAHAEAA